MQTVKIAILGAGWAGGEHTKCIFNISKELGNLILDSVADVEKQKADKLAKELGPRYVEFDLIKYSQAIEDAPDARVYPPFGIYASIASSDRNVCANYIPGQYYFVSRPLSIHP